MPKLARLPAIVRPGGRSSLSGDYGLKPIRAQRMSRSCRRDRVVQPVSGRPRQPFAAIDVWPLFMIKT